MNVASPKNNRPRPPVIYSRSMKSSMERRDFGRVLMASALASGAAGAAEKPQRNRPWPPGIKISVQMPTNVSDEDLQFVQQVGAHYVNIPTHGETATAEN